MKATISANGKTIKTEITEEQAKELGLIAKKKTGYERVEYRDEYYSVNVLGGVDDTCDVGLITDKAAYFDGNYYSDKTIAENNARADKLLRCLRQWQALNDKAITKKDWNDKEHTKYTILYDYIKNTIDIAQSWGVRRLNDVYFSTKEKAKEAIEVFKDELLWYFVEYQQRLDEE